MKNRLNEIIVIKIKHWRLITFACALFWSSFAIAISRARKLLFWTSANPESGMDKSRESKHSVLNDFLCSYAILGNFKDFTFFWHLRCNVHSICCIFFTEINRDVCPTLWRKWCLWTTVVASGVLFKNFKNDSFLLASYVILFVCYIYVNELKYYCLFGCVEDLGKIMCTYQPVFFPTLFDFFQLFLFLQLLWIQQSVQSSI